MALFARHLALLVAAAIPFAILPQGLAWSVEPLARVGARWCSAIMPGLPSADPTPANGPSRENVATGPLAPANDGGTAAPAELRAPSRSALRASGHRLSTVSIPRSMSAKRVAGRGASSSIFVGPESIQRAIPVSARPTSSWTDSTAQHPAGLLIQSPGALVGLLEPGDILVEAEGQPVSNIEQLLVTVRQAYERGAKRLSGRLFRNGDLVRLNVEPGW
jgi:hypothetical protein